MGDRLIVTASADPFTRGLDYLYGVRSLAPELEMVDLVHALDLRVPVCTWIGQHIATLNAQLDTCVQTCHDCFHPWEQPCIQVFAAPLAQSYGLDGVCNFQTHPLIILIDAGRVSPSDWLLVVAHEYAHAHAGSPGHHQQFARSLSHLCLGLAIAPPPCTSAQAQLQSYPHCRPMADPLAFWRGE